MWNKYFSMIFLLTSLNLYIKIILLNLLLIMKLVDWSGGRRLQRNQRSAKEKFALSLAETPLERSDEEARRSPAGKRRPERKSTNCVKSLYINNELFKSSYHYFVAYAYKSIPVATATFNDSAFPYKGIFTTLSANANKSGLTPLPSFPTISANFESISTSV
jgi:hypothetical protein